MSGRMPGMRRNRERLPRSRAIVQDKSRISQLLPGNSSRMRFGILALVMFPLMVDTSSAAEKDIGEEIIYKTRAAERHNLVALFNEDAAAHTGRLLFRSHNAGTLTCTVEGGKKWKLVDRLLGTPTSVRNGVLARDGDLLIKCRANAVIFTTARVARTGRIAIWQFSSEHSGPAGTPMSVSSTVDVQPPPRLQSSPASRRYG